MLAQSTLIVASSIALYALISKRLDRAWITAPMVFVALGLVLGPGLGVLDMGMSHEPVHLLAELTLVLVLFADASRIDLRELRANARLPFRLLAFGMPLTIGLGTLAAKFLVDELTWLEAATLGALLAPTDAALGQAVVSSPHVPARIRQALNVESGLNDGIALPAVVIFACFASLGVDARTAGDWTLFVAKQVILGPLAGIAIGVVGGKLMNKACVLGWMSPSMERVGGLALALASWALAESLHGNGFIAAFVAGMTFGAVAREHAHHIHEFLEAEGEMLMVLVFLMFGASLLWPALNTATTAIWIYAVLSLTLIRMVPVALSLVGSGSSMSTMVFVGWFGPRGLATVLFGLLVVSDANMPHGELVESIAFVVAGLSVLAHGLSALPGSRLYGRANAPAENSESADG